VSETELVQWVADGAVDGEAQLLARIQSRPFPVRIHVLTKAHGWRDDRQLRHHRKLRDSGARWYIEVDEAQRIAASWGHEWPTTWDGALPALDGNGSA
jgi:hypothetical protein